MSLMAAETLGNQVSAYLHMYPTPGPLMLRHKMAGTETLGSGHPQTDHSQPEMVGHGATPNSITTPVRLCF